MATTLTTNKLDYAPGETVTLTLREVDAGSSFMFAVRDSASDPGDDGVANIYSPFWITDGGWGDLDGLVNGQIVAEWVVPADPDGTGPQLAPALNATLEVTATGESMNGLVVVATTTFTDAAPTGNVAKNYQHWADVAVANWNGDILNDGKSDYFEGEVIPHVYVVQSSNSTPLVNGQTYSFQISYNFYNSSGNASGFDYVTTYNVSRQPVLLPNASGVAPVIDNAFTDTGDGMRGSFYTVDADIISVSGPTYSAPSGTRDGLVTVQFIYTGTTSTGGDQIAEIYYGLHIAQPGGAGPGTNGASAYPGGSLQTTIDNTLFSGALSIQLAPSAIEQGVISGLKFNDVNGNGVKDPGELGLAGWTIYLDNNNNGILDVGEVRVQTSDGTQDVNGDGIIEALGGYIFNVTPDSNKTDPDNDPYIVREVQQIGWTQTAPTGGSYSITITADNPQYLNQNFGNAQPDIKIVKKVNGFDANTPAEGPLILAGSTATFTYEVSNAGGVALDNVTVVDDGGPGPSFNPDPLLIPSSAFNIGDLDANGRLDPGEVWRYEATSPAIPGQYTNIATVTATASGSPVVPSSDPANYFGVVYELNIVKTADPSGQVADVAGESITYTITVANTGNQSLTGITVTDPNATAQAPTYVSGDGGVIGTLDVGETWTYSAAHTVTQAEIDSNGGGDGFIENIATADSDQTGEDTDDEAVPVDQNPALNIVKTADPSGQVADVAGESITYTITVANTGNQSLTGITVTDPNATAQAPTYVSGDGGVIGTLDVGETWTYSAAHTVTQAEIDSNGGGDGFIENIATADSDQTGEDTDDEAVPVDQNPALNIVKTADPSGQVADVAGESITYTITVANTGNQSLTGITVTDPNATAQAPTYVSGDGGVIGTLDVGETWTYSAAHTVTQAEIDSNGGGDGFIENIATADSDQTGEDTDDEAVPVDQNPALNIVKTADPSGQVADVAGESITYTITVANIGNQSLTGITVTDPNATAQAPTYVSGDAGVIGVLDVGETWTYSAAHTVTQAEIDSNGGGDGFIENIATADSDQTGEDTDDEAVPVDQNPALNIVKTADPSGQVADVAGESITYTITVANIGNQSLTGITVTDPNATAQAPTYVSGDAGVIGVLDVGETWTYSAAHTVTQAEIDSNGGGDGFIENIATADSDQTGEDTDDEAVPVNQNPALNIVKTADPSGQVADVAGESITYTITVANTGNQSLTGITVTDPNATAQAPTYVSGDGGVIGTLDVGETWTYSAAHTVTQAEIDSNGGGDGFIENIATADSDQTGEDTDDEAVPVDQNPALNIVKTADPSGQVADVAGESITYTITVANTGNQSLTGITVTDPNATAQAPTYVSGDGGVIGTLDVGETWTYSAAHTVTQAEIDSNGGGDGFIENIATADSDQTGEDTDDEAVPVDQNPALNIVKTADPSGQVADVAGESITYTITVANTGNQSLTGITVTDPNATAQAPTYVSGDGGVIGTLDVGETWTYSAAHTVTQAEIDSNGGGDGFIENIATADSDQTGEDTDDEAVPVDQNPALNIVKTADPSGQVADVAGESITYTITVANTGNQSLTGITVTDPNATAQAPTYVSGDGGVIGTLDVGETWTYSAAHTVTQAEIDSNGGGDGFIENIATADSDQTGEDTDDEAVPVDQNPALNIVKTADPSGQVADVAGESITYTITVANIGNQSLTGITVTDPNATAQAPTYVSGDAGVIGVLDVGETWTYSAAHTVTQAEIDSNGGGDGFIENIATADSDQTGEDTDDARVPVGDTPALEIDKVADPSGQVADVAGESITYTITVANIGNQSLTGITVTDPNATAQAPTYVSGDAGVIGVLDVGETWTYSAAHTVTQAEIDSNGGGDGFIENIATADSDQTGEDTDDEAVPVDQNPALNIVKTADPSGQVADVAGESITYTITVANTGNQSLTGITVTDPNATAQAPTYVSGDGGVIGTLDVGETWTYSAAHTVTQAEIDSNGGGDGFIENIATADSDQTGEDTDDARVPVGDTPALEIDKVADPSGQVADVAGESITYTITVANIGNQSLTGITVTDPNATAQAPTYVSGDGGVIGTLDVGETWTYSAAHTVTQAEIDSNGGGDGFIENIATADSDQTGEDTDDEAVPVDQNPALNIVKTADPSGQVADVAGESITYTITVANTGNQSLTGITVTDPNATAQAPTYVSGDGGVIGTLDVGETWTYSAAHTVTQAEIDSNGGGDGFIENIATADSDQTGEDTDDEAVPVDQNPALNIVKTADPSGQVADVAGESITYTITVANTGNQSLTGITVTDPNATAQAPTYVSGDAGVIGVLDVGETWTYSAAHTVTQAEIDSNGGGDGFIENIATADSDQTGEDTDDEAVPVDQNPALNIVKTADPSGQVADVAGESITYTITVANIGNQSLTGITVTDPNATAQAPTYVSGDAGVIGVLDVGETWTYSAAHTVTQAEIDSNGGGDGFIENIATADSDQTGEDTDDARVPVGDTPALEIDKVADPSGQVADVAGESITYTITVANIGNQSLTGITVTDPNATAQAPTYVSGDAGVIGVLDVGETWTYSAAHTVTQAEIDSNGGGDGFIENIATADSDQTGPDTDDEAVPVARNPSLNIVKTATPGQVADVAGEAITYTITVANTGNQSLTGIVVTDPNATAQAPTYVSGDAGVIGVLDVGETWTYSAAHTVTQAEIDSNGGGDGDLDNIATADSDQTGPDTDDEAVPVARNPSLNIVKTATPGQVADVAGEAITYTITVANTGNQSLTGIVVTDPNATAQAPTYVSGDAGVIGVLDVGETWTYSAAHTVTQAEIDSNGGGDGFIDNIATADSDQTGPDTDDARVPVGDTPALEINKVADPLGQVADVAGEAITYTIRVTNAGNQSLTGIVVTDPNATAQAPTYVSGDAGVIGVLDVGETWTYSAAHTVTQAEIDSNGGGDGDLDNIATADSDQTGPDTDDEAVPVAQRPSLNIVKTATPGQVADVAGESITYAITVENTGNQSLTGIVVTDPNATAQAPTYVSGDAGVIGVLDVGETWTYSAAHTVTQAEIDSNGGGDGDLDNIATADSDQTGPDTDDEAVPVAQRPSLNIVKTATPGQVADVAGESITYAITVENTGNQSLTGIVVTDPNATAQAPTYVSGDAGVIGVLDVGETWTYSAAHTVTQAELDSNGGGDGFIDNIATADSDQTGPDTDDARVPVAQRGSIGDLVWEDLNFNGVRDAGEPGIVGVTVNLRDSGGNVVATETTNASGLYLFNNVGQGTYQVEVLAPSGYLFTVRDAGGDDSADSDVGTTGGSGSGFSGPIILPPGQTNLTVDAGLYRKAIVGDRVWLDKDNDGIQDSNEKGVSNVGVRLLDSSGQQVGATTTDSLGNYTFVNLNPGTYTLEFDKSVALTGAISVAKYPWSSKPNAGSDDALDSDVFGSGFIATTLPFALSSGENDLTLDAAITPIVIDLNGNGIQTIARSNSQGSFDLLSTGKAVDSGWLSGDDGFLVVDRNGNGSVDDISEMFGGSSKGAGFSKLSAFDSNGDGVVDANDADFASLKIWRDINGNHQTDTGELMSLTDAGLVGLSIGYSELPFLDAQGNLHLERSSATLADGRSVDMTDVYFSISASDAAAAGVQVPSLAELMGSSFDGLMAEAHVAADPGGMNSMDVQLVGLADPELLGVF